MTTTVTLETHDWPAEVTTSDKIEREGFKSYATRIETVKPHSRQSFCVTDTRTLFFKELPKP